LKFGNPINSSFVGIPSFFGFTGLCVVSEIGLYSAKIELMAWKKLALKHLRNFPAPFRNL
jgi:hypothetical protein